jgi:hypothetical protein
MDDGDLGVSILASGQQGADKSEKQRADKIVWNATTELALARAVQKSFLDKTTEYGKKTDEWKKIAAVLNNDAIFNCESEDFIPHDYTKFSQKWDRMKTNHKDNLKKKNQSGQPESMTEVEEILDRYLAKEDEKADERKDASNNAAIKAGNHAAAELGLNLIAGRNAESLIAAGQQARSSGKQGASTPAPSGPATASGSTGSSITTGSTTTAGKGFLDPMEFLKTSRDARLAEKKRKREHNLQMEKEKLQIEKEKTRQLELRLQLAQMGHAVPNDDHNDDEDSDNDDDL